MSPSRGELHRDSLLGLVVVPSGIHACSYNTIYRCISGRPGTCILTSLKASGRLFEQGPPYLWDASSHTCPLAPLHILLELDGSWDLLWRII